MISETASLSARVYGRVQGVFFRSFTQQQALALGLTGYAKNLPDGTVEVQAEGNRQALEDLLKQLERGPSGARVERVEVNWSDCTGRSDRFEIR